MLMTRIYLGITTLMCDASVGLLFPLPYSVPCGRLHPPLRVCVYDWLSWWFVLFGLYFSWCVCVLTRSRIHSFVRT